MGQRTSSNSRLRLRYGAVHAPTSARFFSSSARSSIGLNLAKAALIAGSSREVTKRRTHLGSCESCLAIDPDHQKALFRLAKTYRLKKDFGEAQAQLLALAKRDPKQSAYRKELAEVHELLVAARMRLHREWKVRYIFEGSRSRVYVSRGWAGRPGVTASASTAAASGRNQTPHAPATKTIEKKKRKCSSCGQLGHDVRICPQLKASRKA